MTSQQIQSQIDALRRKAESGEQWAEICALEDARIAAVTAEHIAACPKGWAFTEIAVAQS